MKTIKDLLNALPKAVIGELETLKTQDVQDADVKLVFNASGNVFDTGISAIAIKKYSSLVAELVKNIPDNWADRIASLDRLSKMPDVKYWISNKDMFLNIQKYISRDEFPQLIGVMVSEFNLEEANPVNTALENNDEEQFSELMQKYDRSRKYLKFVAKFGLLLLTRRLLSLEFSNPNIGEELKGIVHKLYEIKNSTGDTQAFDAVDFLNNTKIDETDKVNYLKENYFRWFELIGNVDLNRIEDELPAHFGFKSKFDFVINSIDSAIVEFTEDSQTIQAPKHRSIQRCSLDESQLCELYDTLLEDREIDEVTSRSLFVNLFSGQDIDAGERIVFRFKNQYSFKFLIQAMYKDGYIEIKEVPPEGIVVGKPSKIFFHIRHNRIKPLKYQKESDSEETDNAKRERERINQIVSNIRRV